MKEVKDETKAVVSVPAPLAENDDFVLVPESFDEPSGMFHIIALKYKLLIYS